jgi:hypothetical protein
MKVVIQDVIIAEIRGGVQRISEIAPKNSPPVMLGEINSGGFLVSANPCTIKYFSKFRNG